MMTTETICVGLDGATWNLIDPWIKAGDLPTLRRLRKEGVWADNQSCLPPSTFPNWKCYSSGKNPGGLGSFWFEDVDFEQQEITIPDSRSFKSAEVWDYLSNEGYKVGVVNVPTTYPPKDVNGYLVAGGPGCADEGITHPSDLEDELNESFDYRVHPAKLPINKDDDNPEAIAEIRSVIKSRFAVARDLLDRDIDFLSLTIFYLNVLQHYFGAADCVKETWELIDEELATLESKCENFVVFSDHGTGKIHTVFWINTWLEQEGYLETTTGVSDSLFNSVGKHRDTVLGIARRLRAEAVVRKLTPGWLKNRIQPEGVHQKGSKQSLVAWDNSVAFASGQGPIYLDGKSLSGNEYEQLREDLIDGIEALESPYTGGPVVNAVHRSEELYSGEYVDGGPDLVVEQRDGVHTDGGIGRDSVFEGPSTWHSENYRTGLFLLNSEHAKTGVQADRIKITDIAPTLLHLHDLPVPDDIVGEVRTDLFEPESPVSEREVRTCEPMAVEASDQQRLDTSEAEDRLEKLGYLS